MRGLIAACLLAAGAAVGCGADAPATAGPAFPLRDGDRVAFVGSGFVEGEQRDGFIETALMLAWPDADVTYRNLGWSGDTVDGRARRFFGPTSDGMKHLLDHLDAVRPTVIVVCYGANEAFDGEAGRAAFEAGYRKLLDEFAKRTPRIALVTPPPLEPIRSPAPQVATRVNEELARQAAFLKALGAERGLPVIDLFAAMRPGILVEGQGETVPLTDDGLLYRPIGYRVASSAFVETLAPPPAGSMKLLGPPPGAEELRAAIVAKNELFFHRHRPENETYLRGFRKHEQGNNAAEIYAFEPLVAEKDREIFALRRAAVK